MLLVVERLMDGEIITTSVIRMFYSNVLYMF
jgi:hypothetical protein